MPDLRKAALILGDRKRPEDLIIPDVKKNKRVIYGRRAMNAQLPGFLRSYTEDFDIYTKGARSTAFTMQGRLDKDVASGRDFFYVVKPALHPGTWRVMEVGRDNKKGTGDDKVIADYTKMPKILKTIKINGILYEKISTIEKRKKEILKDKESKYRHQKDKFDLDKIYLNKKLRSIK